MAQIKAHTDLNLNFIAHPLTGNVNPLVNIDSIKTAIKNLFLLNPYDIPFNPDAYANMRYYLFEPITRVTAANIEKRIEWLIKTFETRVKLHSVEVLTNEKENGYNITITYRIKALDYEDTVTEFFERVR